jgi:hypothetical protein
MKGPSLLRGLTAAAALWLGGCECFNSAEGIVTDAATGDPLAEVQVRETHHDDVDTTGPSGRYSVGLFTGGASFTCPRTHVEFSRAGYRTVTLTGPGDVALERH